MSCRFSFYFLWWFSSHECKFYSSHIDTLRLFFLLFLRWVSFFIFTFQIEQILFSSTFTSSHNAPFSRKNFSVYIHRESDKLKKKKKFNAWHIFDYTIFKRKNQSGRYWLACGKTWSLSRDRVGPDIHTYVVEQYYCARFRNKFAVHWQLN